MAENAFTSPFFEIHGRKELFVDGAVTLMEYGAEQIVLLCGGLKIRVKGNGLQVALLSANKAVISGVLGGFDFL